MSAGALLALFLVCYTALKLVWHAIEPPSVSTYKSLDYKVMAASLTLLLIGVAVAILAGVTALIPFLAWGYLGTTAALTVWTVLDDPVDIEWRSKFYLLVCVAVEVTMIVLAIIAV